MARPGDAEPTDLSQVQLLAVDAPGDSIRGDDQLHLAGHTAPPTPQRLDTIDRQLGLLDVGIQLGTRPDVEPPETLEELPKVLDGRIPKHLGLAVV